MVIIALDEDFHNVATLEILVMTMVIMVSEVLVMKFKINTIYLSGVEINMSMWSTLILMNESFLQDQTQGLLTITLIVVIHIILIGYLQLD